MWRRPKPADPGTAQWCSHQPPPHYLASGSSSSSRAVARVEAVGTEALPLCTFSVVLATACLMVLCCLTAVVLVAGRAWLSSTVVLMAGTLLSNLYNELHLKEGLW
ncbi:hypothetical protein E2C01_020414 [Portunus trituberculatus]|uniref:Uncharacterized protein n=1 Tax=Portunus trituberculatus TaxID=210409 RepID=A0A5B7E280_PORTR|nr:hypothetical protein [Portunus trituberculatus]